MRKHISAYREERTCRTNHLALTLIRTGTPSVGTMRSVIHIEGVNGCDQPVSRHAPIAVRRTSRIGPGGEPPATAGAGREDHGVEAGGSPPGRHPEPRRAVRGFRGRVPPARTVAGRA